MKRRNLADVLLKVLGLSICVYAIPISLFETVSSFAIPVGNAIAELREAAVRALADAVGDGLQAGIGILIICKSGKIAEFWFKGEDE